MRVLITTGGTRGDVQPYVALGKKLKESGVEVRVATADSFKGMVEQAGLEFYGVSIDLQQLLDAILEKNRSNPITQALEFRKHIAPLLETNVEEFSHAAQDADALLYTPATFIANHVARYLGIKPISAEMQPAMRATGEFRSSIVPPLPHVENDRLRAIRNRLSHVFAHESYWHVFKSQINSILTNDLGLGPVSSLNSIDYDKTGYTEPVLCGWSKHVLPRPTSWPDNVHVTGYWFLDTASDYDPPPELIDFLDSGPAPVCVGFGSTTDMDPQHVADSLTTAIRNTKDRAILLSGWSQLDSVKLPDEVLVLQEAPHDWLYPRARAAIHHGGAATVGASLRAGLPTVTIPFWFDQFFWGETVTAIGAGPQHIPAKKLSSERLSAALHSATTDKRISHRARSIADAIGEEDGLSNAVAAIEHHGVLA